LVISIDAYVFHGDLAPLSSEIFGAITYGVIRMNNV